MEGVIEIRWHGRGGQGAATAARLTAEIALGQDKYFQAFPCFRDDGPPRPGEPVVACARFADQPIEMKSEVEHPDVVVLLDPGLLGAAETLEGMPANAVVVVNSDLPPVGLRRKYGLKQFRLYSVPATAIARETTNPPVPTSAMLGAVARVTGLFPVESVIEVVPEDFGKRFGPGVVEGNANAVVRSYEEARGE